MSATVKLSSKLAGDFEVNGLDATAGQLLAEPKTLRCAVVWYDVLKIEESVDDGNHVPTVRLRRFEPLGNADVVSETIRGEVNKAIQERTGRTPIPWDIVEIVEDPDQTSIDDEL